LKKLKKEIQRYEIACTIIGVAGMITAPIEVTERLYQFFLVRDVLSWGWRKAIQVHTYSKFTQILDTHDQLIAE